MQSDADDRGDQRAEQPGGQLFNALFASGGPARRRRVDGRDRDSDQEPPVPEPQGGRRIGGAFSFAREIKSKDEANVWSPVSRNVPNFLGQIGVLTGITDFSTQRNFELLPTFTAVVERPAERDGGEFATDTWRKAASG